MKQAKYVTIGTDFWKVTVVNPLDGRFVDWLSSGMFDKAMYLFVGFTSLFIRNVMKQFTKNKIL